MHQHDRIQHHFNSHPHEEDAPLPRLYIHRSVISTHILTKRMTMFWLNSMDVEFISTHILTKRMTYSYFFTTPFQYFNSHPHEEDDVTPFKVMLFMFGISTHILTKRMTFISTPFSGGNYISTHILTKRMTAPSFTANCEYLFQLTSSRRG